MRCSIQAGLPFCLQVLTLTGEYLREFASPARERGRRQGAGGEKGPRDLAIDGSGRLFVVEADVVAVLTRAGEVLQLLAIDGSGGNPRDSSLPSNTAPDDAGFARLTGITLSSSCAFVTECEKGKVHVMELLN